MSSTADKTRFLKAARARCVPLLKERGFTGAWPTFRRICGKHLVHLVNFQSTQLEGGGVYVNLGVYLSQLYEFRPKPALAEVKEHECAIRQRLQDVAGQGDFFAHGASEEDTEQSVTGLVEMLTLEGLFFLDQFGTYPDDFAARVKDAARHGVAYRGPLAPTVIAATAEQFAELAVLVGDQASLEKLIGRIRTTWTKARGKAYGVERAALYEAKLERLRQKAT